MAEQQDPQGKEAMNDNRPGNEETTPSMAEAEAIAESTAETPPTEEELILMLEDARGKADEQREQLIRTIAELDNLRKRQQRELENAHKFALDSFVRELLQVWDSMELGLGAARAEDADIDKIIEGTELTIKLFEGVMQKFNVEQINPQGEPFNPDLHQAMGMQPSTEVPPNAVSMVLQKGYTLNGRLVRPALVMVSKAAE